MFCKSHDIRVAYFRYYTVVNFFWVQVTHLKKLYKKQQKLYQKL